ncbi:gas vesicle protein GvpH [Haloprofundus salilacus]|uniref:gas vesicle protein GvpH n=1 Tax=Haloprofundus salilacus TaxID=2876190 RepID=UPI001CCEC6D6|nr:gas vesicle protein GvpH [Haloprofundus salilacus]
MTDDRPTDRRDDEPDDEPVDWPPRGLLGRVQSFLEALAETDDRGENRSIGTGSTRFGSADADFDYSIRTGLSGRPNAEPERSDRTRRVQVDDSFDASNLHLDSRVDGDSYYVLADVPGVSEERVETTLSDDGETLVVSVDDRPVGRVTFDQPMTLVETTFRNHVLHAQLELAEMEENT